MNDEHNKTASSQDFSLSLEPLSLTLTNPIPTDVIETSESSLSTQPTPHPRQKNPERETMAILFHELRNPLNGILGNTQLMLSSLNGLLASIDEHRENREMHCDVSVLYSEIKKLKKRLKTINHCGQDQLTILNQVLDFSKLEQTAVAFEAKSFAVLRDLFNPLIEAYAALSEEKGITWSAILPEADQLLVGDAYRLKQIVTNLLSNALKFAMATTGEPASIVLSLSMPPTAEKQQSLQIKVKNTGRGLSDTQIAQLFQPFAQSDPSIARRFGGSGLGLAVCKQLVGLMKGEIICTSSVSEEWVQFDVQLSLPVAQAVSRKKSKLEDEKTQFSRSKPRPNLTATVLLVEDNRVNQKIVSRMLKKWGCVVEIAENGRQAVALYSQRVYSLVLMDIQMPEMDGLAATRAIRELEKLASGVTPIPIIGLSADALTEQKETAFQSGMNDYLTKPILEKDLYDRVAKFAHQTVIPDISHLMSKSHEDLPSPNEERKSGKLSPRSVPRHSPLLFTKRLAPVPESNLRRLSQTSDSSSNSSFSSVPLPDILDEGFPTPSSSADNPLFFTQSHQISSLNARVADLERILQQQTRESSQSSGVPIIDNKSEVASQNFLSVAMTQNSTPQTEFKSLRLEGSGDSSLSESFSPVILHPALMSNPSQSGLRVFTELTSFSGSFLPPPVSWAQRLAEVKDHPVDKARVMLQAVDHYFRAALSDNKVIGSRQSEIKKWIDHFDQFYQTALPQQQSWMVTMALGHWQSLGYLAAQKTSPTPGAHDRSSLRQLAESHSALWSQRADFFEKKEFTVDARKPGCCLIS